MLKLKQITQYEEQTARLIKAFWLAHNDYLQTDEETAEDFSNWTAEGHRFYYITKDGCAIGFIHLGSRGANVDWVEDLFIMPDFQGHGYGSEALSLIENIVKEYSESIYLEVAARNLRALKLYHKNGYNCLNTVTVRKDFEPDNFEVIEKNNIAGFDFEIKRYIKKEN